MSNLDELKLFNLLKQQLIPDLTPTDKFNPTDGTSEQYQLSLELKCRNEHYKYQLIEKKKYKKLILNRRARYITSTPLGIFSFDLKKLPEPNWREMYLQKSQEDKTKIKKEVGFLPIDNAKDISYIYY